MIVELCSESNDKAIQKNNRRFERALAQSKVVELNLKCCVGSIQVREWQGRRTFLVNRYWKSTGAQSCGSEVLSTSRE